MSKTYNNDLVRDLKRAYKQGTRERNNELLPLVMAGDSRAREEMIISNAAIAITRVAYYARRFKDCGHLRDDMISTCLIRLCKDVNGLSNMRALDRDVTDYLVWRIDRCIWMFMRRECVDNVTSCQAICSIDIARESDELALIELRDMLDACCTDELERNIIKAREEGMTMGAVAAKLGISKASVFRLLRQIESRFNIALLSSQ